MKNASNELKAAFWMISPFFTRRLFQQALSRCADKHLLDLSLSDHVTLNEILGGCFIS